LVIDSGSLPIRQAFELCNFHKAALGKSDGQLLKPAWFQQLSHFQRLVTEPLG
jgi:hypothetical protein